jgi:hypothetical protein
MSNFIKKFQYQTLSDLHNAFDNIETEAQFNELINTTDYSTCLERGYGEYCYTSNWNPQYNIKQDFYNIQKRIVSLMPRLDFCCRWYHETKRILELKMCPDEKYYEDFVQFLLNIIYKEIVYPMLASPDTDVYKPIAHEIIKKYDSTNPKRLIKYIAVCIQNEKNTMDKKEVQLNQQNNYHNDTYNNGDTVNQSGNGAFGKVCGNVTINNNTYYTTPVEKSTCENKGTENNPSKDDLPY